MRRSEKISDIRDHPVVTGLNEEVVIERLDVLVNRGEHVFDGREITSKLKCVDRISVIKISIREPLVPDPIDLRKPPKKFYAFLLVHFAITTVRNKCLSYRLRIWPPSQITAGLNTGG